MKTRPKPYTIRLDESIKKQLEAQAKREDRSAAQLAVRAIESMLQTKQAKYDAIEAAMSEADTGEFISEEAMTKWVMSWGADNELPEPAVDVKQ
jgi:predicted transcriptional regulator